ncbi:hypothetical protein FH972_021644 [Carpinus fangiana]|uniref:Uncharacterized protein n=1 Tax=Carpinus fangiana TaxID=176857 RepID=A0A5N6KQI7_9ROSI|nr:hypothetical protein FH972_021644 [Carpinus fangiana]
MTLILAEHLAIDAEAKDNEFHATTCSEYLQQEWPQIEPGIIDDLASAARSNLGNVQFNATFRRASQEQIVDSAVRLEPFVDANYLAFDVRLTSPKLHVNNEGSCWRRLFRQTIVVRGFHTKAREAGVGLELSSELLMDLCQIQWHMFLPPTGFNLENLDLPLDVVDLKETLGLGHDLVTSLLSTLLERRHFLGWCQMAKVTLGTSPSNGGCYSSHGYTKVREKRKIIHLNAFNLGLGSGGLGFGGPTAVAQFTISSSRQNAPKRLPLRFESIVTTTRHSMSILYDPVERRDWLVPLLSVLYHMAHLRLLSDENRDEPLGFAEPSWGWTRLARDVTVVLFCRGLGEVILPHAPGHGHCRRWPIVPSRHDLLCTTVSCLRQMSIRFGDTKCKDITEDCIWCSPDSLFQECRCPEDAHCLPVQQVRRKRQNSFSRGISRGLPDEGAVIFGRKGIDISTRSLDQDLSGDIIRQTSTESNYAVIETPNLSTPGRLRRTPIANETRKGSSRRPAVALIEDLPEISGYQRRWKRRCGSEPCSRLNKNQIQFPQSASAADASHLHMQRLFATDMMRKRQAEGAISVLNNVLKVKEKLAEDRQID